MTVDRTEIRSVKDMLQAVQSLAAEFADQRHDRQRRRHLDAYDFERLKDAGYLAFGVPEEFGGAFESPETSGRALCAALRTLAKGDPSVALVACMHPAVTFSGGWLTEQAAPAPHSEGWNEQRRFVARTCLAGHWWGTITSEPGSGGDVMNTRTAAVPAGDGRYLLSGTKHFGSGSGIASFMLTTAVPDGEDDPDWFFVDMRDVAWDGSQGVKLVAEWDGHGMTSTQSHSMEFRGFPAVRTAHPGAFRRENRKNPGFVPTLFASVIVGVVAAAVEEAERRLAGRKDVVGAFERVEWVRARQEAWLVDQAFEGMLRDVENGRDTLLGKLAVAELAESATARLCRVMGGGSYARHSPFGFWAQDVKALGFLRPPWALGYEAAYDAMWNEA